ncbi:proline permease PrnB [Aspergillus stella-maris]|uniref:proline permease PrnB n=1 Tax=Aspergillus stella-maris TaxID=1810926 RepID=UPI003CCE23BB
MADEKPTPVAAAHHGDPENQTTGLASAHPEPKSGTMQAMIERDLLDERYANTQRGLKNRHVQLMALGGTIGTGLFVGSGQALNIGGPLSLLLGYIFISTLVYSIVTGIAEVGAYLPVHGGTMSYHGFRYVSRSLGFAMGYLYWYSLGILVPYEIVAASLVIDYWPNSVPLAAWITIMLVVIVALNYMPVGVYGETEFWFAGIKIITLIGLLLLSFILFWGGGPNRQRLGFHYWKDPGAMNAYLVTSNQDTGRFIGLLQCIVRSAIAFIFAPELIIVTAGEMESPRRNVPKAARRYIYRLVIFYLLGALAIGVICSSQDPALLDGDTNNASASPFVAAIQNAGIPVLRHIVNAAILTSAWSAGNSFLYMSSRSLYGLAVSGNAPSILKTCNRWGVPWIAVSVSSLFSLLSYLAVSSGSYEVFNWLMNFTNTSGFISWICCCIVYFRFTAATKAQGVEKPYKSRLQPYGIYIGLGMSVFMLLINGFTSFFPQNWSASNFFTAYIGIPAFVVLYVGHRVCYWGDPWVWNSGEVDLTTGLEEILAAERPYQPRDTWGRKVKALIE